MQLERLDITLFIANFDFQFFTKYITEAKRNQKLLYIHHTITFKWSNNRFIDRLQHTHHLLSHYRIFHCAHIFHFALLIIHKINIDNFHNFYTRQSFHCRHSALSVRKELNVICYLDLRTGLIMATYMPIRRLSKLSLTSCMSCS